MSRPSERGYVIAWLIVAWLSILCACLRGDEYRPSPPPLPEDGPTVKLRITLHLGKDHRSAIARSELVRDHPWFQRHRAAIEQHYRIVVMEDAFSEPMYQIGRGDEQHPFRRGTFNACGTFIYSLRTIAENDQWEREYVPWGSWQITERQARRPEIYPPLREDAIAPSCAVPVTVSQAETP